MAKHWDGKTLGSGVLGTVRLVTHKKTKILEFDKMISTTTNNKKKNSNSTGALQQMWDEIFIMCQLDHPNIVCIEEVYESPNKLYIVQELCLGGDLFDRLDKEPDWHQTKAQCAKLVKQMLLAVRYLCWAEALQAPHYDLLLLCASERRCFPIIDKTKIMINYYGCNHWCAFQIFLV
ncbi:hypothetical protein ACA910_014566 [Epithemia clementina (nom. ined.)]